MGGLPETRESMEYTSSSTVSVELESVNNDSSMSGDIRTAHALVVHAWKRSSFGQWHTFGLYI